MATKPSADAYLTADLQTCRKCGVTQQISVLRSLYSPPALRTARAGQLRKVGADFKRTPDVAAELESDAQRKERLSAPWECIDVDACTKRQVGKALREFHDVGNLTRTFIEPNADEVRLKKEMDRNLEKARKRYQKKLDAELKKLRKNLLTSVVKRAKK